MGQPPTLTPLPPGVLSGEFENENRDVLTELITYLLIVERGGISAAADEIGRERPAISARLKRLEDALGAGELLVSGERAGRPTLVGSRVVAFAERVIADLAAMREELRKRHDDGEVRVATIHSIWVIHGLTLNNDFEKLVKNGRLVEQIYTTSAHVRKAVESDQPDRADVGIVSYPPTQRSLPKSLRVFPWRDEPLMLVASSKSQRLAGRRVADRKAFMSHSRLILSPDSLQIGQDVRDYLRRHTTVRNRQLIYLPSIAEIKDAIASDLGLGILPRGSITDEQGHLYDAIPLSPQVLWRVGVLYRRDNLRPAVKAALRCCGPKAPHFR